MTTAQQLVDQLWSALGTSLMHGTALALVTAILCATLLRGARPALICALWTLVLVKFLLPLGPAMPASLSSLVHSIVGVSSPNDATVAAIASDGGLAMPMVVAPTWWSIAKLALAGVYLSALLWLCARRWRLCRALYGEAARLPALNDEGLAVVSRAAAQLGMKSVPTVVVGPSSSPYVVGMYRPLLVVPGWMTPKQLYPASLHELAHLRRGDTWLRGLQVVVGTLLFFWPVLAWVNRQIDHTREVACDQWALSRGGIGRRAYARLLVTIAGHAPRVGALALLNQRGHLEKRVDAVLKRRWKPGLGGFTAAALVAWSVPALAGVDTDPGAGAVRSADCQIDEALLERLRLAYPDADSNQDGVLSRSEVCDYKRRLERARESQGTQVARLLSSEIPDTEPYSAGFRRDALEIAGQMCEQTAVAACEVLPEVGRSQNLSSEGDPL